MKLKVFVALVIPLLGTCLGASMVFFLKHSINDILNKILLGFASGVMVAASIWSLILPSINMAKQTGGVEWAPAALGFLIGIAFLLILDNIIPHLHANQSNPEGIQTKLKRTTMLVLVVTLHNIPEGMAVGVVLSGLIADNSLITFSGALALSIGIAIQNFPEGAIVSMPLKLEGISKKKAFLSGSFSGVVEPIAAIITILLSKLIIAVLPYLLSFAAGAMIYVVIEELIPEAQTGENTDIATIGFSIGFVIMMVLDIALG